MEWSQMAVFLYAATLTHFLADFLNHWMEKKKLLLVLHCLLYALFFTPLFLWMEIGLIWLFVPFLSHLIIDSQRKILKGIVNISLRKVRIGEKDAIFGVITLGVDQTLHLLVLLVIAIIVFQ